MRSSSLSFDDKPCLMQLNATFALYSSIIFRREQNNCLVTLAWSSFSLTNKHELDLGCTDFILMNSLAKSLNSSWFWKVNLLR
jgi:hypothetical protein